MPVRCFFVHSGGPNQTRLYASCYGISGLSAAGYLLYQMHPPANNGALLAIQVLATLTAALYFTATALCEANPAFTGDDTGTGEGAAAGAAKTAAGAPAPAAAAPGFFGALFSREKQEAAIAKGVAAGAVTAGQALFAPDDPVAAPAPGGGATAPKASLFTGGSLFPSSSSSSSKYGGYGDERPEANPFLSS